MRTAICLAFLFITIAPSEPLLRLDDFATIKQRVVDELMKSTVHDDRVDEILGRMQEDGSFADINYLDLSRRAGFPHRRHTSDLVYLAKAYKNSDSDYYRDLPLKQRIVTSLRYWVDHDFVGDNWHNNQISTPTNLVNLMLVMGDELPKELVQGAQPMIGRAHMNASGARPSGDRIVIAGILAKNLLFVGDREGFDEVIAIIAGEVKFSTGKRGMQHDYSFHHRVDRVNNTTSYGYGKYANAFGEWSYYVAGTKYAFPIERLNHLVDYYLDGIYKQLVYGIYTDISVKNRSISHQTTFEPRGTVEIERLLAGTDYRRGELEEILRLRKGEAKPSLSFCKFFWQTEHFVFQRPNFYTTVRMFSTRNRNMEKPYNGPGKTTHHRADGTNYLMLKGDEYHNIWPVYDWQKISGTTIMQKPQLHPPENIQLDGVRDFVGAVTDGMHGAVAFDFVSPHDGVAAKKAWFFFEDEYVCLGAGIRSEPRLPVVTTIDQVRMRDDIFIRQGGEVKELPRGSHRLENVTAIYHDRVGYVLPIASPVHISNQREQGRWSDITDQKNISTEIVTEDMFMAWFDHGPSPDHGSYAYIVVPDVDQEQLMGSTESHRGIDILSNTTELQAVKSHKLDMVQLIFHKAGQVDVFKDLTVKLDSQGMAMVKTNGDRIQELTVSDPSRKLSRLLLTLSGSYDVQGEGVSTHPKDGETLLLIDLPQGVYAGRSVVVDVR